MSPATSHTRPIALLAIAATAVGAGAFIGATTNAINGAVSPAYFQSIMQWGEVEHIWRASVAQGIFEGLIYGLVFSVVFTLVAGIVSKAQCTYAFAVRQLLAIIIGVYCCWVIGGLIGMGLAALSPDFFQRTFFRVPEQRGDMLRYAWVGGSIWGAMAGGVLALAIGAILFAIGWRRARGRDCHETAQRIDGSTLSLTPRKAEQ